jgi:hypothetical protein
MNGDGAPLLHSDLGPFGGKPSAKQTSAFSVYWSALKTGRQPGDIWARLNEHYLAGLVARVCGWSVHEVVGSPLGAQIGTFHARVFALRRQLPARERDFSLSLPVVRNAQRAGVRILHDSLEAVLNECAPGAKLYATSSGHVPGEYSRAWNAWKGFAAEFALAVLSPAHFPTFTDRAGRPVSPGAAADEQYVIFAREVYKRAKTQSSSKLPSFGAWLHQQNAAFERARGAAPLKTSIGGGSAALAPLMRATLLRCGMRLAGPGGHKRAREATLEEVDTRLRAYMTATEGDDDRHETLFLRLLGAFYPQADPVRNVGPQKDLSLYQYGLVQLARTRDDPGAVEERELAEAVLSHMTINVQEAAHDDIKFEDNATPEPLNTFRTIYHMLAGAPNTTELLSYAKMWGGPNFRASAESHGTRALTAASVAAVHMRIKNLAYLVDTLRPLYRELREIAARAIAYDAADSLAWLFARNYPLGRYSSVFAHVEDGHGDVKHKLPGNFEVLAWVRGAADCLAHVFYAPERPINRLERHNAAWAAYYGAFQSAMLVYSMDADWMKGIDVTHVASESAKSTGDARLQLAWTIQHPDLIDAFTGFDNAEIQDDVSARFAMRTYDPHWYMLAMAIFYSDNLDLYSALVGKTERGHDASNFTLNPKIRYYSHATGFTYNPLVNAITRKLVSDTKHAVFQAILESDPDLLDATFIIREGTHGTLLTVAAGANNLAAARVLLELGADRHAGDAQRSATSPEMRRLLAPTVDEFMQEIGNIDIAMEGGLE